MNRKIRIAAVTAVVGAVIALPGAQPAGAQIPEVPELDFTAEPLEGRPGDLVNGRVAPASVAENCNLDVAELQNRFESTNDVLLGEVADVFFPNGFDPADPDFAVENFEQAAWVVMQATAANVNQQRAEEALPQTFVMTFADIATQEPVGERANFDPAVGEATVTVPDVEPGPWAVAATCVSPSTDATVLADAVRTNTPLVEEWLTGGGFEEATGVPFPGFPITDPALVGFGIGLNGALAIGETLVPAFVEPDALGFEIFCVLDASGQCPGEEPPPPPPPPPPGPGPDGRDGRDGGDEPGPDSRDGRDDGQPETPPARPITAEPSFVG